ncbi:hypothetical protein M422DRAFT_277423 [Sphaerobolus stellatus SS14]|uniref:BTB domain-containing protein n=1 Tax=Sphaerobolus stellatus (strain SS14) TaxID=990650 RepID=A0A0C9T0K3_SPHS4|nr:hypothetical protein M422DRAFT_277423 [Sphaerobolus stellatus SS14]
MAATCKRKESEIFDDQTSPNNKRARSSANSPEASTSDTTRVPSASLPTKSDSKVYHDDGNIVIVAEDIAFRVHRTFLSGRSEIFRDMFIDAGTRK